MKKISFGTDGWRGIIADDFTFDNVELVAGAVSDYVLESGLAERGVVVGYDSRFLSERFAQTAAGVFRAAGIPVFQTGQPTPTPVTAFAVKLYGAAGAVMITASHNPPEYNGLKFIPEYAGPAMPDITAKIEENIRRRLEALEARGEVSSRPGGSTGGLFEAAGDFSGGAERSLPGEEVEGDRFLRKVNPLKPYAEHVTGLVDVNTIGKSSIRLVVNPMCGAGCGYLEDIFRMTGAGVEAIHNNYDPLFNGIMPDPSRYSLEDLRSLVVEGGFQLGLALDGDGDRFGIIDGNGRYIVPNQFLPLVYYHLLEYRGMRGPVVRTVATTHMLDRVAQSYKQEVEETPVGFKYIARGLMEKGCILGGEESGGLSIKGHIPEKDGILAGLLAAEIIARRGTGLAELLDELARKFGRLYSERLDVKTSAEEKKRILSVLPELDPPRLAGSEVTARTVIDGVKLVLESGAWVLVRPSGTEPLFRIYVEANSREELEAIQKETKKLLGIC